MGKNRSLFLPRCFLLCLFRYVRVGGRNRFWDETFSDADISSTSSSFHSDDPNLPEDVKRVWELFAETQQETERYRDQHLPAMEAHFAYKPISIEPHLTDPHARLDRLRQEGEDAYRRAFRKFFLLFYFPK